MSFEVSSLTLTCSFGGNAEWEGNQCTRAVLALVILSMSEGSNTLANEILRCRSE